VSIKHFIREIDRATAYTRQWRSYESLLNLLTSYGIPLFIFMFCFMVFLRFVIRFELRSFLNTIFSLFSIHGFIGEKMREEEQEKQEKIKLRSRRREARRQRRYKEHGLVKKKL